MLCQRFMGQFYPLSEIYRVIKPLSEVYRVKIPYKPLTEVKLTQ